MPQGHPAARMRVIVGGTGAGGFAGITNLMNQQKGRPLEDGRRLRAEQRYEFGEHGLIDHVGLLPVDELGGMDGKRAR